MSRIQWNKDFLHFVDSIRQPIYNINSSNNSFSLNRAVNFEDNILEMGNEELKLETFPIHTGGNMADKEESQTPEDGLSDSDVGDEAKYPVSNDNALNETVEIHNQSSSCAETSVSVDMLSSSVAEEHDGGQQEKSIVILAI